MYPAFRPGMFHLIQRQEHTCAGRQDLLKHPGYVRMQEYLDEYGGYPRRAMYNIIGVLRFQHAQTDQEKEDAIDSFRIALSEDPNNLNACENSRQAYDELGKDDAVTEFSSKVDTLLKEDTREKNSAKAGIDRALTLRKARCLAEQAMAIICSTDVFEAIDETGGQDFGRYLSACEYFRRAFNLD